MLKFERRLLLGILKSDSEQYRKRALEETSEEDEVGWIYKLEHTEDAEITGHHSAEDEDDVYDGEGQIKQKRKRRPKAVVDPNAPKRPANAFILFSELSRESVKEERGLLAKLEPGSELEQLLSNMTKALGLRWRNLPPEDRAIYQEAFKELVLQYESDYKQYRALPPNRSKSVPMDWLDPSAPKRPAHPFFIFCEMEDDRIREFSKVERTREEQEKELQTLQHNYGHRWRTLADEERQGILLLISI
jgi:hypothetical protein